MKLNCDLGESFGAWTMGQDERVMPLIDMANIACGFHAADPLTMHKTVSLAVENGVLIGAHPSYHDLAGFGRRSIPHTPEEIMALMLYQLGALEGFCRAEGTRLVYVKPHGALNNDMMKNPGLLETVMTAIARYRTGLSLMIPVTLGHEQHQAMADQIGLPLILEAFADRAYDDDGLLVPRSEAGAVHRDPQQIVRQALSFANKGGLHSRSGKWLDLPADSLCVHGDNDAALEAVRSIRQALAQHSP
ncbi:MAG: 5-oxoprolinase subunit PxpA [Marinobacter sp.]|uniref:5-oxoprolinase subunit PxpA n=1 Tax=Marinobacter sp. TaxID=50741 RepID=UPI00299E218E|nr:5-oxoprolinase subunit PxpA [Marinobacter sp.]MDX1755002.1 5-oxoprolinase subunit PxpA [Marinobacter sp.]